MLTGAKNVQETRQGGRGERVVWSDQVEKCWVKHRLHR